MKSGRCHEVGKVSLELGRCHWSWKGVMKSARCHEVGKVSLELGRCHEVVKVS